MLMFSTVLFLYVREEMYISLFIDMISVRELLHSKVML